MRMSQAHAVVPAAGQVWQCGPEALTCLVRCHWHHWRGTAGQVWHYGPEALKSITAIMLLRESIRPYVSSVMKIANATGVPALRSLFLEFPHDALLAKQAPQVTEGQFMFGPDYLVAPVTAFNASSWPCYLPTLPDSSARWVHHYTNTSYKGGQLVSIDVSNLDTFPLFRMY